MAIKLTQGMKNMFYKYKGPEATKCYIQLTKSYNQEAAMISNIIYSHVYIQHESCKDLQHSNFLFWGKGNEDKAELSSKSSNKYSACSR